MSSSDATDATARVATRAAAPATCGELVQGTLDGHDFLVNCPIDLYATATASPARRPGLHICQKKLFDKVGVAATALLARRPLPLQHELSITSDIPPGRGLAASSAAITCSLRALCLSCEVPLTDRDLAEVLTAIGPSSGVQFPGIAHVNRATGELLDSLPAPQGLRVLAVDSGTGVDAGAPDPEKARAVYDRHRGEIRHALALLKRGLRGHDNRAVGSASTLSAIISQQIVRKPLFERLLACVLEVGAVGLNCAHGGTVTGVLYDEAVVSGKTLARRVRQLLGAEGAILGDYRIVSGGALDHSPAVSA